MMASKSRERTSSEVVFAVLKTLMIGYQLWGVASGFRLSELSGALCTTDNRLGGALTYLAAEGLICLDESTGTVRLSAAGARHLLGGELG